MATLELRDDVDEALKKFQNGEFKSLRETAGATGVKRSTSEC